MRIHLNANVIATINAIDANEVDPLVDYGPYTILLDTSQKQFGTLLFTRFMTETREAMDSYSARYSTIHTIHQILATPLGSRYKYDEPIHTELPYDTPPPDCGSNITPGC